MGISGSRGKKVAPVSVTEGDPSAQALKCQTSSVGVAQKNTLKDRLGNRLFSMDDRILAEEVDRILEECENTKDTKKSFPESPPSMCENYAFCCNRRDRRDTDTKSRRSADILPTDLLKLGGFEDTKDICTCNNINKPQKQTAVTALRADPVCAKTTHVPGVCDDFSLALPVSYDASEEDLMSAIEREFG